MGSVQGGAAAETTLLCIQGLAQQRVLRELRIGLQQLLGGCSCILQNSTIIGEAGQSQIRQARLTSPQHLSRSAQAQIHLGDLETIGGAHQHIETLAGQGLSLIHI